MVSVLTLVAVLVLVVRTEKVATLLGLMGPWAVRYVVLVDGGRSPVVVVAFGGCICD